MITVTIGGEAKQINDGISISQLLVQENVDMPNYVSVSVNDEFVKTKDYESYILHDGDVVEFLYFMGGGR